ncbi:MAG TPA: hypothetical protein VFN34_12225, partial [Ornithinibacter sp.]|nr:hypothetical protein [Ornithinibacter sp.]
MHPLDPLTAEEIDRVRELLTSAHGVGAGWRYASIEAVEPAKADLAAYANGGPLPPRRAEVICFQRRDG